MDTAIAMELLMKSAAKTYPLSRALTNPLAGLATGGAAGAGLGFLLGGPPGAGIGAGVGAGAGYLWRKLIRHLAPGTLADIATYTPGHLMKSELGALESVARGKKIASLVAPLLGVGVGMANYLHDRHMYGRALQGRIERGGIGLTNKERVMIDATRSAIRREKIVGAIKGSAKGAGALAALAAALYAGKKLTEGKEKKK